MLSSSGWSGLTDDIGDSFRTAQVLTLDDDLSAVVQSQIDGHRDKDMFVFTAPADGQLQIDMTTPDSDLDSYLYLYDDRGHRLAQDDDSGDRTDARIVFTMEAGSQYYIRADAFRRSTGSYTLKLQELTQEAGAVDDFGNTLADATVLVFAADGTASQAGRIDWPNDQDMFVFTAVGSGLMQIDMTTPDSELDSYLYVYASGWMHHSIAQDDDSGDGTDARVELYVEAGQTYYIRADAWRDSTGDYTLIVTGPAETVDTGDTGDTDDDDDTGDDTVIDADGVVEGWALLIGAHDYPGTINDLPECATDVEMIREVLIDVYGFSAGSIHTVTGGAAEISVSVIDAQIDWLSDSADADDVVFFYYTGHGTAGSWEGFNDDEAFDLPNGEEYTESHLTAQLQGLDENAAKIVVIDTCYAGGFAGLADTVSNTCVLASSAHNQSSWGQVESYLPAGGAGSVFTSWLVEALLDDGTLGVDANQNGLISMREAFNYADNHITALTFGRNLQDPVMNPTTGEFEILLTA